MKLTIALIFFYHLLHAASGKGLTMITRGCIVDYLKRNQLLNVSYAGPVPRTQMCRIVIDSVKKSIIDIGINEFIESNNEVSDSDSFLECTKSLIERHNVSDLMLKNHMYQVEEIRDRETLSEVVNEVLSNFYYLCAPNQLQNDLDEKFPNTFFTGYEKASSRMCLFNLLREKEVIDRDFELNFEVSNASDAKCPSYINEGILEEKSEAMFLLRPSTFYENEATWECAAQERMKIGYVRGYYRLLAHVMMGKSDESKKEEREKFLEVLKLANENLTKCLKIHFNDEI